MNSPTHQSCSNCRCWTSKENNNNTGYCRAHPPERVGAGQASFPTTTPDTWCNEWVGAYVEAPSQPDPKTKTK